MQKYIAAFLLLTASFVTPVVHAACTDSYSQTTNSITINWDVSDCKNLHQKGDYFEICWKENTTNGLVCQQNKKQFTSTSGSHVISGLKASKGYTVKTSYQRKAKWDQVGYHNITTNTAPISAYTNHTGLDANSCRTIRWGGVPATLPKHQRYLAIGIAPFGKTGTPQRDGQLDIEVTNISPNAAKEYSKLLCDLHKNSKYSVYVVDKEIGSTAAETTLTSPVIFAH